MRHIKKIVIAITFCFTTFVLQAVPSWTVNESLYSNSMTITSIIIIDGTELTSSNDMIAAFVGTECRGVTRLLPSTVLGHSYAYLVINSNEKAEKVTFKVFQSSTGNIVSLANTYTFVSDATVGNQIIPYIFSDKPITSSTIETMSFGITGETVTIDNTSKTISVTFPQGTDVTTIHSISSTSLGSLATIDGDELSATSNLDLSKPITIIVTSQNGTISNWTITASITTGIANFENIYDVLILPNGTIQFVGISEEALCTVYSLLGQTIVKNKNCTERLDLSTYSNIPVVIRINNQNKLLFSKLIIVK